ncbi:MAG: hypothetical protein UHS49_06940, partial [Faecalimonas sp.]|nr:hypothetical protein [Faecalimonas sp.]
MRKSKRLWAVMLAFVMMVNLIPATVTGTVSEAADSTEAVRYVSASGDDTANDGTTADTAYASIKKAITDLNGVTADNKVVKIVGECAW